MEVPAGIQHVVRQRVGHVGEVDELRVRVGVAGRGAEDAVEVDGVGINVVVRSRQAQVSVRRAVCNVLRERAFSRTGRIVVIVDDAFQGSTFRAVVQTRVTPVRRHGLELAVDEQIVEDAGQGLLLYIDAAALHAVAAPSGVDNRVVVGADHGLVASGLVVLSGGGQLQAVCVR